MTAPIPRAPARETLGTTKGNSMAIEKRRGRAAFCYLRVQTDSRSRKRYVGSTTDPVTDLIVRADRLVTAYDRSHRQAVEDENSACDRVEPCLRLLSTRVTRCVNRYRQKVRRAKESRGAIRPRKRKNHMNGVNPTEQVAITREEFDELVFRATGGSDEAVADLRDALRANPACYRLLGDLARHVQICLVELITKDAVVAREALNLKMDDLRESLLGEDATALERLVAEEVVASWLDLSFHRIGYSQEHSTEAIAKRREQRLERGQKRHLAAARALHEIQSESNR